MPDALRDLWDGTASYNYVFLRDEMIHMCSSIDGGLVKPLLRVHVIIYPCLNVDANSANLFWQLKAQKIVFSKNNILRCYILQKLKQTE